MTAKRRYRLLCPIARALDAIGDRWALLIVRDLHAGPARFQDLETGLGIATNLLSTRLAELTKAGLIEKSTDTGRSGYQLTEVGRHTDKLLWELSRFGGLLDPDPDPREPGNLRTIALPLRLMLGAVPDRPHLVARLLVDDDSFTITSSADGVEVEYGETASQPDLVVRADYEGFLDAGEGRISLDEFTTDHLEIIHGAAHADAFLTLMTRAMTNSG
ncbi:MAG: DNA-binding transcriptional regulator, HxlR family [Chloroflexi bacterium]|nr:MAG: DNA-binding transcriptional regulator, HxlR family [Chloroflexota bacterium]